VHAGVQDNVAVSSQAIQIAAGVLVVSAFAGLQLKLLDPYRAMYLVLNLIGTAVLTAVALSGEQFGFVLTNGVWAVVSLLGLVRVAHSRLRPQGP
jgi:hypothetical protein